MPKIVIVAAPATGRPGRVPPPPIGSFNWWLANRVRIPVGEATDLGPQAQPAGAEAEAGAGDMLITTTSTAVPSAPARAPPGSATWQLQHHPRQPDPPVTTPPDPDPPPAAHGRLRYYPRDF